MYYYHFFLINHNISYNNFKNRYKELPKNMAQQHLRDKKTNKTFLQVEWKQYKWDYTESLY